MQHFQTARQYCKTPRRRLPSLMFVTALAQIPILQAGFYHLHLIVSQEKP